MSKLRVAHLISHPIQYYVPLYQTLQERGVVDLHVFYRSDRGVRARLDPGFGQAFSWDMSLTEGYRHTFLVGAARETAGETLDRSGLDFPVHLAHGRYDLLWIHGYTYLANLLAAAAAGALGIPVVLRDDATLLDERPLSRRIAKDALLYPLMQMVAGGLYVGQQNRRWLQHYGLRDDQVFFVPHSVDNARFQAEAARLTPERAMLRARFGFRPEQTIFLFSGKLVPKKAPLDLVKAFAAMARDSAVGLLIAGDGPLRSAVEEAIRVEGIEDHVHIAGFLNQTEIGAAYAAADVLILPSAYQETWGLVVNEAMNFGLPIIVSDKVGCASDLVQPDRNGFIVPAGDMKALSAAMSTYRNVEVRLQHGTRSRQIIAGYTIQVAAAGIERAACALASAGQQ